MSVTRRREMIDSPHANLSLSRQCQLLNISRSGLYYTAKCESALNLSLMRLIDEQYLDTPWYGSRQMTRYLRRQDYCVGRKRIRRLMRKMGLVALAPGLTRVGETSHMKFILICYGIWPSPSQTRCGVQM